MGITYRAKVNSYVCNNKGKQIAYSVNQYGELAILLAEQSMADMIKRKNYIIEKDGNFIMKIYSNQFGKVFDCYIDKEDIPAIQKYKWYITHSKHSKTYYVASDKIGKLHRFLMKEKDPNNFIDHINHNGLDNRKQNLRVVDNSTNKKNGTLFKNNTSGTTGVSIENNSVKAYWMENGKLRSKRFSFSKYDNALELAISYRKNKEIECGYVI